MRISKASNINTKIDILLTSTLSDDQLNVAIGVWRKLGVFKTYYETAKNLGNQFHEETIWKETFFNYQLTEESDCNKMYRLTTQIIDHYKKRIQSIGVARINIRKDGESYNLICNPGKHMAGKFFDKRTSTAATHMIKAHHEAAKLGRKAIQEVLNKAANKLELHERMPFLIAAQEELTMETKETSNLLEMTRRTEAAQLPEPNPELAKEEDIENGNIEE